MKRIIYIYCLLILISCDFSEKKVYKNLYITNGGENQDYNVAAIKLDENNQLNVFPFEVKDYYIDNKYKQMNAVIQLYKALGGGN